MKPGDISDKPLTCLDALLNSTESETMQAPFARKLQFAIYHLPVFHGRAKEVASL